MMKTMTTIGAAVCFAASGVSAQELTTNGDFETGDTSGWVEFPTANSTFNITSDSSEGDWAAEIFNNDAASAAVVKQANIGIGTVNPGDMLTISFSAKGSFANGGVSFAEFFSEVDGGGTSSNEILGGGPLPLTDTYEDFSFNVIAGSDVTGGVTLQFTATTGGDPGSTAVVFIDDVSVVPEPASLGLLGLSGLALLRRRSA
ncbi:MAG: PEP-CTERM sorting domain-containing protein [Planctomycetota bacterium]